MAAQQSAGQMTAGGAIFTRLKALGVDVVFANSGTDFPPVIEGLAQAAAMDADLPLALVIPHEHVAMGMAHGYFLVSGRPQAVMLHTNVGLSNGATGAINAACEHIPMIIMSGRTPVTEVGTLRRAHRADRVGPGDARPDRAGARGRQVGLRAALPRADRPAARPRPRHRAIDAEGPRLPVAAA